MATNHSTGVALTAATAANVGQSGSLGGVFTVQITNKAATAATVELGVSATTATFEAARKILEAEVIQPGKTATYGPVVCANNDYIVGESDTTLVNMVMMGKDD